jgi:hypothetical protein
LAERDSALPADRESPGAGILGAAFVLAGHLGLVAYFAPRNLLASDVPVLRDAFGIEAYRVARMRVGLELSHRPWIFDPLVLAGQFSGFVERLGTRVFLLGVSALGALGLPPAKAFDVLIVAHHAVFPLVGFAAARAFGLSHRASTMATALWSLLWFFDSLVHALWFTGRAPWDLASALVVLAAGLAYRAAGRGGLSWALGAALVLGAALLVHPVAGLFGAGLGAVAMLRAPRILPSRRVRLLLCHVAPVALLGLPNGGAFSLTSEPVARLFRAGVLQSLWDFIDVVAPGQEAPGPSRTLVRTLALVAGAIALARFRASDDRRFLPLSLLSGIGVLVAYVGGVVPVPWPVDPYLFLVPAMLAASLPAAWLIGEIQWIAILRRGAPAARIGLALAALVIVPRLFRTVASYVPELLPERVIRSDADLRVSALAGLNDPMPDPLRHAPPAFRLRDAARWLSENAAGRGRVLVDDAELSALLAVTTGLQILGPLGERGSPSAGADPTTLLASSSVDAAAVSAFLERYAVGWVVLGGRPGPLDRPHPTLEAPFAVGGFRVRRVLREPNFFVEGTGRIARTGGGVIGVEEAGGPRVTIRFHHDPRLRCRPDCRVERAAVASDRAGFITVPSPPPSFEVYVP